MNFADRWTTSDNGEAEAEEPQGKPVPSPCSFKQLALDYPNLRPPVIDGLLRVSETANVISNSKRGKTWLTYGLGLSVVVGRDWLDTFPCTKGRVLILDGELHKEVISHRIPAVAKAMGLFPEQYQDLIDVISLRGQNIDLIGLAPIIRAIKPGCYVLVILDAWYRFLPTGFSENDNAAVMSLYNYIDAYAAHLQSAWLNIHHASKGDQSNKAVTDVGSGAGSQSRAADTHLVIRPHEEEDVAVIEAAVRSFPPVEPIAVRWNFPLWELDTGADPRKLKGLQSTRERVAKERKDIHLDDDRKAIVAVMVGKTEQTMTEIRNLSRVGNPRFGFAWASLVADQTVTPAGEVLKGNKRRYESFTLSHKDTE